MTDQDSQAVSTAEPPASGLMRQLRARLQPNPDSSVPMKLGKWAGAIIGVYLVLATIVGIYWSGTPRHFDVRDNATRYATATEQAVVTGTTTVTALQETIRTLLEKPGGYLHNDIFRRDVVGQHAELGVRCSGQSRDRLGHFESVEPQPISIQKMWT